LVVLLPLVAGIVWLGLFPGPVLQRIEPAARRYIETVRGPMAALDMSQRIPGARP
jgi:NADH:ubiquinone oxidoreductase subunit 4 (subunit M)